jgi:hypothetical protein
VAQTVLSEFCANPTTDECQAEQFRFWCPLRFVDRILLISDKGTVCGDIHIGEVE